MKSLAAYLQIVNMGIQMIAAYRVQAILETASMLLHGVDRFPDGAQEVHLSRRSSMGARFRS